MSSWLLRLFNDTVLPAELYGIELDTRILIIGQKAAVIYWDRLCYPDSLLEGLGKRQ